LLHTGRAKVSITIVVHSRSWTGAYSSVFIARAITPTHSASA
jgi:hypothetical protein